MALAYFYAIMCHFIVSNSCSLQHMKWRTQSHSLPTMLNDLFGKINSICFCFQSLYLPFFLRIFFVFKYPRVYHSCTSVKLITKVTHIRKVKHHEWHAIEISRKCSHTYFVIRSLNRCERVFLVEENDMNASQVYTFRLMIWLRFIFCVCVFFYTFFISLHSLNLSSL